MFSINYFNISVYNIPEYIIQLCDWFPSPNGESVVDYDQISSMPLTVSFSIGNKTFKLTPDQVWFSPK